MWSRFYAGKKHMSVVPCESVLEEMKSPGELAWAEPKTLVRGKFLRTLPGIHPCDGFFAAVLAEATIDWRLIGSGVRNY